MKARINRRVEQRGNREWQRQPEPYKTKPIDARQRLLGLCETQGPVLCNPMTDCGAQSTKDTEQGELDRQHDGEVAEYVGPHETAEDHVEREIADVYEIRRQKNDHRRARQQRKSSRDAGPFHA